MYSRIDSIGIILGNHSCPQVTLIFTDCSFLEAVWLKVVLNGLARFGEPDMLADLSGYRVLCSSGSGRADLALSVGCGERGRFLQDSTAGRRETSMG